MNLKERISAQGATLTPAERQLADALLTSPVASAFETATTIAARAGVHAAALVRLAQKLGFAGFSELRESLREELIDACDTGALVRLRLENANSASLLRSVVEQDCAALRAMLGHVSDDDLKAATHLIVEADRVMVFGDGTAEIVSVYMARRLSRVGVKACLVSPNPRHAAEAITALSSSDLLVATTFRMPPPLLPPMLREARGVGARILIVSDLSGRLLSPQPDCLLAAPRGPEGQAQSYTVPLAIANALMLSVADHEDGQRLHQLNRYSSLRDKFEQADHPGKQRDGRQGRSGG